ncbi:MAG: hypothetical protein Q8K70_00655 [Bacteroidota bacterium]|nr:hypothetical protein [Bacteroidota bacterium]
MKKIKWILLVILIAAIAGYLYINEASKENDPTKSKESIAISVNELCDLFVNNEDSANALYLSKVIDIKGAVSKIENNDNRYSLYLNNSDGTTSISCEMDTTQNEKIKLLKQNQEVNIKGYCIGMLIDLELNKCRIID